MKKWIIISAVIVLIIASASWLLFHKKKENESGEQTTQTVDVKKGTLEVSVNGSGSVTSKTDEDITAANTVLPIESVSVSAGDSVDEGDTLVTFTNGDVVYAPSDGEIASVAVKSGSVASQGTILVRMTNDEDITLPITRGTTTSASGNEGGEAADGGSIIVDTVKVSKGNVVKKGQTLATFTDGSILQSPAAGTITSLSISSGDSVNSADTIAHITDYKSLQTTISVDELDISKIKVKQAAEITASAFEDEKFEGVVTEVASSGTAENGVSSFDVTISITDPKSLKIGMSTEAKIVIESKEQALYVPLEAVYTSGDQKYVLVPSSDSTNSTKVTVETGLTNDTYTEITKGLAEGNRVLIPQIQSNGSSQGVMMGGPGGQEGMQSGNSPGAAPPSGGNNPGKAPIGGGQGGN